MFTELLILALGAWAVSTSRADDCEVNIKLITLLVAEGKSNIKSNR